MLQSPLYLRTFHEPDKDYANERSERARAVCVDDSTLSFRSNNARRKRKQTPGKMGLENRVDVRVRSLQEEGTYCRRLCEVRISNRVEGTIQERRHSLEAREGVLPVWCIIRRYTRHHLGELRLLEPPVRDVRSLTNQVNVEVILRSDE